MKKLNVLKETCDSNASDTIMSESSKTELRDTIVKNEDKCVNEDKTGDCEIDKRKYSEVKCEETNVDNKVGNEIFLKIMWHIVYEIIYIMNI